MFYLNHASSSLLPEVIELEPYTVNPSLQGIGSPQGQSLHQATHVGAWPWPAYGSAVWKKSRGCLGSAHLCLPTLTPKVKHAPGRADVYNPRGAVCVCVNLTPGLSGSMAAQTSDSHLPAVLQSSGYALASICGAGLGL